MATQRKTGKRSEFDAMWAQTNAVQADVAALHGLVADLVEAHDYIMAGVTAIITGLQGMDPAPTLDLPQTPPPEIDPPDDLTSEQTTLVAP